jgi:hypothetical protein
MQRTERAMDSMAEVVRLPLLAAHREILSSKAQEPQGGLT